MNTRAATLLAGLLLTTPLWSSGAQESGERRRIRILPSPGVLPRPPNTEEAKTPVSLAGQDTVQLQFGPSSDVKDVLNIYQALTGQPVLYSNVLIGPIPLVVDHRVPKAEAVALIEKALFANGFALIDSSDRKTIQVTGIGESPAHFPLPVFTKLAELPEGERVVKMVFKIRHRNVVELADKAAQAYPPAPYMQGQAYAPDPKSKTLVVTERTGTIREIAKLIEQLDVTPPK